VSRRYARLTELVWTRIQEQLPRNGRRGGQWKNHRKIVEGIVWKVRTGAPWRDIPAVHGPWQTCYDRFVRWRRDGTWDRVLAHAQAQSDNRGDVPWEVCADSTAVRAHQHAAGARHQERQADAAQAHPESLGRSRGGLSTKIHLACDGRGRPLSIVLSPGQRHDSAFLGPVLQGIRVPRPRGRPRTRPDRVIADKGYSYARCQQLLRRRGIKHIIPQRRDQRLRRSQRPGRPLAFDTQTYARRNVIERCINKLKQWRSIATRYEKRAANCRAMVVLASIVLWLDS